jgi:type VI secretion system protein ImpA
MRRAQAAEIMVGAGMSEVALPILRELVEQIDSFRLEEWESGDTVAQPLGLLYRCAVNLGSDGIDAGALYDRVCRLDPVRAIQIKSGGGTDEGS